MACSHAAVGCRPPAAPRLQTVRLVRPLQTPTRASAAPTERSSSSSSAFEQQYSQLSGVLAAPGGLVAAGPTPFGRGLIATGGITAGAELLSVPWANLLCVTDQPGATGNAFGKRLLGDWQLLHGKLPPLLNKYLLGDDGDWFVRLVAWLLWLKRNAQGPWRLYIDLLPREEDMSCLMNYTEAELPELQSPLLEARARVEREQITALHERLFSSASGELRTLQLAEQLEDTLWAACMVNSRCFSDTIAGETVSLVVPCADMANHVLRPNASYAFSPEEDAFVLRALRDVPAGAECCISYGCTHKDSLGLMRDYGFCIPGNVNDRIPFSAGDDIASQLASGGAPRPSLSAPRLLAALGLGTAASGTGTLDLTAEAEAAMDDTEAAADKRRLLATVLSLQAFLRDTGAAAAAAAAAAAPLAGGDELQRERQSVAALEAQCHELLGCMPTSATEDEALLQGGQPLGPRVQAAVAARLERKRLLGAAAAALQRYGGTLAG